MYIFGINKISEEQGNMLRIFLVQNKDISYRRAHNWQLIWPNIQDKGELYFSFCICRTWKISIICITALNIMRKRKRSDSVLWQKPLHQQQCQKGKVTTQTTPQKSSIKQRLRTDLGRSVGVTKATQLVWLTGLRAHLPTNRNSRLIKRTHV